MAATWRDGRSGKLGRSASSGWIAQTGPETAPSGSATQTAGGALLVGRIPSSRGHAEGDDSLLLIVQSESGEIHKSADFDWRLKSDDEAPPAAGRAASPDFAILRRTLW